MMASKIVMPDLEKSFSKDPKPINAMLASAVKDGIIHEFHTPRGLVLPVPPRQETPKEPERSK